MNDRDKLRENRLVSVQTFGQDHAADSAANSKGATLLVKIDQHLSDLAEAKAGQVPGRASKATLLDALWLDFKNIARTSRSIGAAALGGSLTDYELPADFTEANIKTHADILLRQLEEQEADTTEVKAAKAARRAKFVEWEMDAEFVAGLRDDYDALVEANKLNLKETQEGVENTEAISQVLLAAGATVDDLDTVMNNKYNRQPEKLKAWLAASRVHRAPTRSKKAGEGTGGNGGSGGGGPGGTTPTQ